MKWYQDSRDSIPFGFIFYLFIRSVFLFDKLSITFIVRSSMIMFYTTYHVLKILLLKDVELWLCNINEI